MERSANCDRCKWYSWYYDYCEKWRAKVDWRSVYNCFEPIDTPVRDFMVSQKEET